MPTVPGAVVVPPRPEYAPYIAPGAEAGLEHDAGDPQVAPERSDRVPGDR
ncbi:hypothetical protein ACQEVS_33050 [Streptomyces sp. CA-181903]